MGELLKNKMWSLKYLHWEVRFSILSKLKGVEVGGRWFAFYGWMPFSFQTRDFRDFHFSFFATLRLG